MQLVAYGASRTSTLTGNPQTTFSRLFTAATLTSMESIQQTLMCPTSGAQVFLPFLVMVT